MKSLKKKVLVSAVLAAAAGSAHAVYVNQNGQGQALIYPYYTVQGGHNTYVSVVNTTSAVKVVKVRFREGKASAEVLDFNLYLSPNDVWTGAVVPSPDSQAARIITTDTSCTNPQLPDVGGGVRGIDFRNYLYSGSNVDAVGDESLSRTREGYLEMIEMGTLNPLTTPGAGAVHTSLGVPANCALLRGDPAGPTGNTVAQRILPPTGGMNGTGTLINVTNGQDSGYSATALADLTTSAIYAEIGDDNPNFTLARPDSLVVSDKWAYRSNFTFGEDAVSSVLMHNSVINEYVLDTGTLSNTDWVFTFPTKRIYVDPNGEFVDPPFSEVLTERGACEEIEFKFYDREERAPTSTLDFSPKPPASAKPSLCWESSVLSIRNGLAHTTAAGTATSGVLGSKNVSTVTLPGTYQNGWASVAFTKSLPLVASSSSTTNLGTAATSSTRATYAGLPVVGFMVRTFNNGVLGNFQANYGSAFEHKYSQNISPKP